MQGAAGAFDVSGNRTSGREVPNGLAARVKVTPWVLGGKKRSSSYSCRPRAFQRIRQDDERRQLVRLASEAI